MTHRPDPTPIANPRFVRRMGAGKHKGKYEHGYVLLGETREKDKYVRVGIVGTYEEAANAENFEPAAPHNPAAGGTYYENLHSRNQGNHYRANRG